MINTIRDIESLLNIAALLLSLLGLALIAWLKSKFIERTRFEEEKRARELADATTKALVDSLDRRVMALELALKNLPSASQLHELSLQLSQARGDMAGLSIKLDATNERVDHLNHTVSRHESLFAEGART